MCIRDRSDAQVIKRLINVADSRFQEELLAFAKTHGKLDSNYAIPDFARNNTPDKLEAILRPQMAAAVLPEYPFGTELTPQEQALGASLRHIKSLSEEPRNFLASAFKALLHRADEDAARPFLERVHLEHPGTTRDFLVQQMLLLELEERGMLKVS